MKILLLNSSLHPGSGVSRVAVQIGNGLIDRGHEVIMLTLGGDSQKARFEVRRITKSLNITNFREVDVIYSHYGILEPFSAYLKLKLKRPLVLHDHGTAYPWLFNGGVKIRYSIEFLMRIPSIRLANRIITISKFLQRIIKAVYHKKSTVIYNGISGDFFFSTDRRKRVRQQLKLTDRVVVLFVGRWSSHKRIHQLVSTIAELRSTEPSLALLLVGTPTSDRKYVTKLLKTIQNESSTVLFSGPVSDEGLCSVYSAADIYASYSAWEGFNLPIFEAMRTGIPIVAFNKGSHQEFANIGFSLARNPEQFKEMLLDLASDPELRKRKGSWGLDFSKHFTWKSTLDKVEAIFDDVIRT